MQKKERDAEDAWVRLAAIVQWSDDAIISKTLEGIITSWNPAAERLFGYKSEEMIGQHIIKIIPDDRINEEPEILKKLSRGELVDHFQTVRKTKTGKLVDISLTISPIRNSEGVIIGASKIARDITQMKLAEEELKKSEMKYKALSASLEEIVETRTRQLLESNNELKFFNQTFFHAEETGSFGTYRYNFNEEKLIYSDNLYRLLGCEPGEFESTGENFLKFVYPADRAYVEKATNDAFQKHTVSRWEYRLIRKDGRMIWVRGTGKIITDDHGVQYMVGTLQDISFQKNRELLLMKSEEKFNKLFAAAPLGLTLTESPSGVLVDVNDVQLQLAGYTREEYIGKTFLELKLIDSAEYNKILSELQNTGTVRNFEVEIQNKEGKKIPVLNSLEFVTIGDTQYVLSAIIDISDRKKTEKEIERANIELKKTNDELEAFTYISSHDLQEPLRKIQTFASRFYSVEKDTLSDDGKVYLQKMIDASNRLQVLIQDLLTFSRVKKSESRFETVNIHNIIEEVKEDLKDIIEENNVKIETGKTCDVKLIRFQFRQLFENLISNSIKFARENVDPVINISSTIVNSKDLSQLKDQMYAEKHYCLIHYTDNGIGFEQSYASKIFEVFQKLHAKSQYPGTGIGLAIVKRIVENHHGFVEAHGKVNEGAEFDIYLPV